jgi:hypothetical protein
MQMVDWGSMSYVHVLTGVTDALDAGLASGQVGYARERRSFPDVEPS